MKGVTDKVLQLKTYSQELGIDLATEEGRFKWFLASILFAKRIGAEVARRSYRELEKAGIATAEDIIQAGWDKLVQILDAGGYVRYDFSTASNLLEIATSLKEKYGSLDKLYAQSQDGRDLEKRLLEFKGVGPTTVNIFLREAKAVWQKARPRPSPQAMEVASKLGLPKEQMELPDMESALVRLNLEFCKHGRCTECPVKEECPEAKPG